MHIPFEQLPETSRIWIYQADRSFTSIEENIIYGELLTFTESWLVHGKKMEASFALFHHQFIVVAADESAYSASGCSIDTSVHTIKSLGEKLGVDFFNRSNVAFYFGSRVQLFSLSQLKTLFTSGELNRNSLTFNNLISCKKELTTNWVTEVESTWLKRYLPQETLTS
jgi:hypothetical protein